MTLEARKHAFKKSLACGPSTIILTAILTYFLPACKACATTPVDFFTVYKAMGMTVAITSIICCLTSRPMTVWKSQTIWGNGWGPMTVPIT